MSNCDRGGDAGATGLGTISMATEGKPGLTFILSKSQWELTSWVRIKS